MNGEKRKRSTKDSSHCSYKCKRKINISKTGMPIQPKVIVYGKGCIPHLNLIA